MTPANPAATADPLRAHARTKSIVFAFFFLSGACGLIYEVVWMRLLGLLMGHTVHSVTTVLTAFMGGLALGSYLAGRIVDGPFGTRHPNRPLLIYGVLEAAIGLYCALLPHLIHAAEPLFQAIYPLASDSFELFNLLRFLVCGSLLLIPTTFMGATLPALSRYLVARQDTLGLTVGRLYALNTFGAVFGSFATGFFFIPWFGMRLTTY
ncbi:MAG: hypothetical protein FJ278_18350, partial [Planctomycetes bacterium]|nr:hypothetical protein [Planctomycetota bacterium]